MIKNIPLSSRKLFRQIFALLHKKQKIGFAVILLILGLSAVLTQFTPLAAGYLTDHILAGQSIEFSSVLPILIFVLLVNVIK